MRIAAEFVTSAAAAAQLPRDGVPQIALVGRSNVGKSTLINALARRSIARTSAVPGKTRLANLYRVQRGNARPVYLVDLPGFGYARTRRKDRSETPAPDRGPKGFEDLAVGVLDRADAVLFLVDARHPGLENDRAAWEWLRVGAPGTAIVATKADKLARGERIRALAEIESVFQHPVTAFSAVTGEGLDELWKLIETVANNSNNNSSRPRHRPPAAETALRPRKD